VEFIVVLLAIIVLLNKTLPDLWCPSFQVTAKYRSNINIPVSAWSQFRDIFNEFSNKLDAVTNSGRSIGGAGDEEEGYLDDEV